jgi:hypothetical protein
MVCMQPFNQLQARALCSSATKGYVVESQVLSYDLIATACVQGYTNAVKRPLRMSDISKGLPQQAGPGASSG